MTGKIAKRSLWIVVMLFVGLSAALVSASAQTATPKTHTVTGCLQKGLESEGFFLIAADGHHWELYPGTGVSLADHVGHTVTVTGSIHQRSAEQEKVSQPSEKKETGSGKHGDFQVTSLTMVSPTCSK